MDNCSVMRGVKNGVEQKIKTANPNVLSISGDTVHMFNNAAKAFFEPVEEFHSIRKFAGNVFYDIEDSPKARSLFKDVQFLLGKSWSIFRPISSGFLQMRQVCDRLLKLWEPLLVYYYAFLTDQEQKKYASLIEGLKEKMSAEQRESFVKLLAALSKQKKGSAAGCERKDNIFLQLFNYQQKTLVVL